MPETLFKVFVRTSISDLPEAREVVKFVFLAGSMRTCLATARSSEKGSSSLLISLLFFISDGRNKKEH